jgi:CBS domain-containing protein
MLCADVMKGNIESISPQDSVETAAQVMRSTNIGFLPVCDEDRTVLGTITDRDIALRVVAEGRDSDTSVAQVMTREVVSCHPTDDIKRAEQLMGERQKSRIMCVDDEGALVGVISLSDIAQRDGARIAQTIREVTGREVRT